jgi:hypothetical protein
MPRLSTRGSVPAARSTTSRPGDGIATAAPISPRASKIAPECVSDPAEARLHTAVDLDAADSFPDTRRPTIATDDPEAANLMFSLVSSRYERASMIVTSNKPFSAWGEIFGDYMAATAMIDRLIHHSEILSLKGDSYRLRGKDLDARIGAKSAEIA